jgi:putative membrane protein
MIEYVLLASVGCMIGVVTGLIPGLHVNTVAVLGLGIYASLGMDPTQFAIVLASLSITHAFLDFLPAIFIGAPQEDTALSILPAQMLFLQGRSMEAVKITALGSLLGLGASLLLMIPALYVIPALYNLSRGVVAYLLLAAVLLLLFGERKRRSIAWAAGIFLISGWFGVIVLERQNVLSSTEILFPVFAGLFGLSNLLNSLKSKVAAVPQDKYIKVGTEPRFIGAGIVGAVCGALIGVLPAISPSQMGALIADRLKFDAKSFLVFLSSINTADAVYSILALYTIQNARSGVGVIIGKVLEVDAGTVMLLAGVMAFSAFFAAFAHIEIGKRMAGLMSRIDYGKICVASLLCILILIYAFTGVFGLLIAGLATVIGLLPIYSGVSRTHLMGVLLVPTIMFFLGL